MGQVIVIDPLVIMTGKLKFHARPQRQSDKLLGLMAAGVHLESKRRVTALG